MKGYVAILFSPVDTVEGSHIKAEEVSSYLLLLFLKGYQRSINKCFVMLLMASTAQAPCCHHLLVGLSVMKAKQDWLPKQRMAKHEPATIP